MINAAGLSPAHYEALLAAPDHWSTTAAAGERLRIARFVLDGLTCPGVRCDPAVLTLAVAELADAEQAHARCLGC